MCAAVYELCERVAPGFVQDVASWLGLTLWGGLVIQVKKTRRSHEGLQRNILGAVMGVFRGLRLVVVVAAVLGDLFEDPFLGFGRERRRATCDHCAARERLHSM